MHTNVKYTSSGIIRNADKPRVGVTSMYRLAGWVNDEIFQDGIDLSFEEYTLDLAERGITEETTPNEYQDEIDAYTGDEATYLFGDAG